MVLVESQHCAYDVGLAAACECDGDFISGFYLLADEHGQRLAPIAVLAGAELSVQAGNLGVKAGDLVVLLRARLCTTPWIRDSRIEIRVSA